MGLTEADWPTGVGALLRRGTVIPAHPLALDASRKFAPTRQKALSRYYIDAGVGGLAVGVHTTQFAIRDAGLYEPVLRLASETAASWSSRPLLMIAGAIGRTEQARREAEIARDLGYHAVLLSLAAWRGASENEIIEHCRAVGRVMPLVGFYLQPAVGGVVLRPDFWRRFAEIDQVVAIKIAPFHRYRTLDVIRGVVAARAERRVALYTGNDDHIVLDLVQPFHIQRGVETVEARIVGGLLGHWSVWTKGAVELHRRLREAVETGNVRSDLLALDSQVTDCNSAFFDVANDFFGCIAGCHEVLRRQGLLEGIWCLDPDERLGPGQAEEIDRVLASYPQFADDAFIRDNLNRWLA